MKKLFIAAFAVLSFGAISAQEDVAGFSKGNVFVTGVVGFTSTSGGEADESSFEIMPQLGYFVTENIAIGARVGFNSTKMDDVSRSGFGVGAFGRYYFTPASKFSLFGELAVDYDSREVSDDVSLNTFGAGLGLGLNYFVSKNFSLEAGIGVLGFASGKADVDGAESVNAFSFGGNFREISLGLNYRF
jgi:opacity protein-like surface antigen